MGIDPELVKRFRADLAAICGDDGQSTLGIAYSGGPDSLALLLLAQAAFPGRVEAATVDHGLRPESADEARHAAATCAELGVPHEVLNIEVARGNVQAEARRARYAALAEWAERRGIGMILTAHHADDQAETFLMRANRGSGYGGLAGVRRYGFIQQSEIDLARPLLQWRRSELEEIVGQSGFAAVADPSNIDESFDRVRIRKALNDSDFISVEGLARSAALLSELEDDLDGLVMEEWERAREEDGAPASYRPFARSQVYRPLFWSEVVRMFAGDLGFDLTRKNAGHIVSELLSRQAVNAGGIQARAHEEGGDEVWTFAPENPRRTG